MHGHNWNVEAVFTYQGLDKDGLAIDFHDAKRFVHDVIDELDHSYLNEHRSFKKTNPTSEIVAKYIFDAIKKKNPHIWSVSVWENDHSCATYREG